MRFHAGSSKAVAYHVSAINQHEKISETAVPVKIYTTAHYPKASSALAGSLVSGIETILPVVDESDPCLSASTVMREPDPNVTYNLSKSVVGMLPPTMKKFTLQDKICVVTGYVGILLFELHRTSCCS